MSSWSLFAALAVLAVISATPIPITMRNIVDVLSPNSLKSFFALPMDVQTQVVVNAQKLGLSADDARTIAFSSKGDVRRGCS
jgi:hypothetical protein